MSRLRRYTATVVSAVAAETHFVLQSSADAVAKLEGIAIEKLVEGKDRKSVASERKAITKATQQKRLEMFKSLQAKITPKKGESTPEVVTA